MSDWFYDYIKRKRNHLGYRMYHLLIYCNYLVINLLYLLLHCDCECVHMTSSSVFEWAQGDAASDKIPVAQLPHVTSAIPNSLHTK